MTTANRYHLPTACAYTSFVQDGGLLYYGSNVELKDQYWQMAVYVDRILKGDSLPIQGPTRYELIINFRTAKALGIEVSHDLLNAADEVIE